MNNNIIIIKADKGNAIVIFTVDDIGRAVTQDSMPKSKKMKTMLTVFFDQEASFPMHNVHHSQGLNTPFFVNIKLHR